MEALEEDTEKQFISQETPSLIQHLGPRYVDVLLQAHSQYIPIEQIDYWVSTADI